MSAFQALAEALGALPYEPPRVDTRHPDDVLTASQVKHLVDEANRLRERSERVQDAIADADLEHVLKVWRALVDTFGREPILRLAIALRDRRQLGAQAHELPPVLVLRALRDFLDDV